MNLLLLYSSSSFLCSLRLLLLIIPVSTKLTTVSKPGCGTRCGNLEIPYPFGLGLGSNCSIGPWFDINCNTSTNPPKPFLSNTDFEVISISESQIRVKYPNVVILKCYDFIDGKNLTGSMSFHINLTSSQYTLSHDNWLTALGCDDFASVSGQTNSGNFAGGCLALCSSNSGGDGFCPGTDSGRFSPGNGCCQTRIPAGTTVLSADLQDLHGHWRKSKYFPCSYAFVGERESGIWSGSGFWYRMSNLMNLTTVERSNSAIAGFPLVLDWRIGTHSCNVFKKEAINFVCKANSRCIDEANTVQADVGGYRCVCFDGYEGNPYLGQGCHDINECASSETNNCAINSYCVNLPGSYSCFCPKGYTGDGDKHGTGCRSVVHSVITKVAVGLASGIGSLLLLLVSIWLRKMYQKRKEKRQKEKFFKRNGGLLLQQQLSSTNDNVLGKTNHFPASELEKATDHFNENRIVGRGGQGTVYKGMLSDGKLAAIKKSQLIDENQVEQFINEVAILSQLNHRNIVKLLGCCLETKVPLLIYEFVPNGTLFDLIHDENSEFPVSWTMRLKIAADVASALAYLHSASSLPVYHRDIKSSNILLDERYVAKVADFGTSRSFGVDQTHLTTLVKGTFGYLDPEYFQSSQFTEKSDVYSFGVVLVELLTGQKPICFDKVEGERSLATRFLISMGCNSLDAILDAQVLEQGKREEVLAFARLAQRCLNLNGKKRPTMKEVAMELESVRMSQMPESKLHETKFNEVFPSFYHTWTGGDANVTTSTSEAYPLMLDTI